MPLSLQTLPTVVITTITLQPGTSRGLAKTHDKLKGWQGVACFEQAL